MLLSWNWLQDFVTLPASIDEVAERLTVTGSEVESLSRVGDKLSGVRVAQVIETSQHPTKSGLTVTTLDLGNGDRRLCVTAAKNVKLNDRVPYAQSGACIADGTQLSFRDFDGFRSDGMMISAAELGVPELSSAHGILILPADAPLGADVREWLSLDDWVIDLSITANRGDMLSYLGTARELCTIFLDAQLHVPVMNPLLEPGDWPLDFRGVTLVGDGCLAYRLGAADQVTVAPSPLQWALRLCRSGMRPVSNVVDATNLAMLALGQPLHAFDAASLPAPEITIRAARPDESMVSLDHKERRLNENDLVISSGNVVVGLAGVMGGQNSEITETTDVVLLESANFAAPLVSRTSRRLGMPSEAAYRYARGVDPRLTELALRWTDTFLTSWGAARVYARDIYVEKALATPRRVRLTSSRLDQVTGTTGLMENADVTFARMGVKRCGGLDDVREYEIPSWRHDLTIEEDLIEELSRLKGYNDTPTHIPELYGPGSLGTFMELQRDLRATAIGRGYSEAVTYSFISPEWLSRTGYNDIDGCATLTNPISADLAVMRPLLLPSLLAAVSRAEKRGWRDAVRLFECGKAFVPESGAIVEHDRLCGLVYAGLERRRLYSERTTEDFFTVKGDLEALLACRGWEAIFAAASLPWGHAGQTASVSIEQTTIGHIARLKPSVAAAWNLEAPLFFFEFDLEMLGMRHQATYRVPGDFPPVYRDLAMLVPEDASAAVLSAEILTLGAPMLRSVKLFDIYQGQGIPKGQKSLAFSMAYRSDDRTMTDTEVEERHRALRQTLAERGYSLR